MGGGLAAICSNINRKDRNRKRLMDYSLILLTMPMMISGAIMGVTILIKQTIMNHFLCEFVITILFTILICYLTIVTYKKYILSKIPKNDTVQITSNEIDHLQTKDTDAQ
jgi:hypothetical protein